MDPATIIAITGLVKALGEVLGLIGMGWFLPQPKFVRRVRADEKGEKGT